MRNGCLGSQAENKIMEYRWISVNKALPVPGCKVIVYYNDNVQLAKYSGREGKNKLPLFIGERDGDEIHTVTAWMFFERPIVG